MNPFTHFKNITILPVCIPLTLACFGLSPEARAVVPAPDGGYPGGNTAEGQSALFSLTTGGNNTAIGHQALFNNTTGFQNTATGFQALFSNIIGRSNTANGFQALFFNIGNFNTANGYGALRFNTTGGNNTATGANALRNNTIGIANTANGLQALYSNKTGNENTATGGDALFHNTDGIQNTATGYQALFHNTTSDENTATGYQALFHNTDGIQNTATGNFALFYNTTGRQNTATGNFALYQNTIGIGNTAYGAVALLTNTTGVENTANGEGALALNTTGSRNIALGIAAGNRLTTGDNNIDIGNVGVAGEANTIRIGTVATHTATFIAGISGKTAAAGIPVIVNANGKLGTTVSSARFKDEIKPMDKASEAIHALKPVTFRYKQELDPEGIQQFGLIAEHVEKVNPNLVARDDQGKVYTVRYDAVNAMLLNEFLKEHRKVEEQQATITQLKKEIETVVARLKEQDSKIQRVSDQIELSKPAPRTVVNNQESSRAD
jgi:hypothetical protein